MLEKWKREKSRLLRVPEDQEALEESRRLGYTLGI